MFGCILRKTILHAILLSCVLLSYAAFCAEETANKEPEFFTIIALPDTQIYSESFPALFMKQTEWIKENKDKLKIACVVHLGDITNHNTGREWENANKALSVLDGVVPLFLVPGNHDTGPGGGRGDLKTEFLDKFFPPSRFEKQPWFGGIFEKDTLKNAYYKFDALGRKYIVLCLEFGPRDEVLEWGGKILDENKDRKGIIVTHCYMNFDDTRVSPGDAYNPHDYPNGGNDGEDIWNKLVKKHANMFLVLSGHILNDGRGRQTSKGDNGNVVQEVLANYQMLPRGGEAYLRIMKFVPSEKKIYVTTYSPDLDKFEENPENKFELDWDPGE